MKYTKYILSNKLFNIDAIQTKNPVLAVPMVSIGIPIVILGLLTILFTLPAAAAMDQVRRIKYFLIKFERINNYQYGSQTHFSNLCRDYIRIPYLLYLGPRASPSRIYKQRKGSDGLRWWYNPPRMDNIHSDLGWDFLVVENATHNREYG